MACTRVAEDDAVGGLMEDEALFPYMKVVRFPAVRINNATGEEEALWPERYNLDQLWAMKAKLGDDVWDLAFMHVPGTTERTRVFTDEVLAKAKSKIHSLTTIPERGDVIYLTLDPALGGMNCCMALQPTNDGKLIIRWVREESKLRRNEEIMEEVAHVATRMKMGGATISDLVVEENNFQKGLRNDDRLKALASRLGFVARGSPVRRQQVRPRHRHPVDGRLHEQRRDHHPRRRRPGHPDRDG